MVPDGATSYKARAAGFTRLKPAGSHGNASEIRDSTATFSPRPRVRFDILRRAKRRRGSFMMHTRSAQAILAMAVVGVAGHAYGNPARSDEDTFLKQSRGVNHQRDIDEWRKKENRGSLKPYPSAPAGTPNPTGRAAAVRRLRLYVVQRPRSRRRVVRVVPRAHAEAEARGRSRGAQRARVALRSDVQAAIRRSPCRAASRSRSARPAGCPRASRAGKTTPRWSPDKIRDDDAFPYKPLDHPLHSTAHMLFPNQWTRVHPEHERFDVGIDIPDCFLPEFPPPLYLTTHPELGDVTRGVEITYGNYFNMFNGIITARAARRAAHPGHAVPDDVVQRDAPPRHRRAVGGRDLLLLPRQRSLQRRHRARARLAPELRAPPRRHADACAATTRC